MKTKNPLRWVLTLLLVSGLGLGLAACGDDDDDDASTETTAAEDTTTTAPADDGGGDGGESATMTITDLTFPQDFTVPAGATITVENSDDAPHTVTADDGEFDVDVEGSATAELTAPSEPGEYAYHCNIHSSMVATLVVE